MSRKILFYITPLFLFFVISCGAMKYQMINADMSRINLGMQQDTVIQRIGKPNHIVIAQKTEEGELEVYEYLRRELNLITEKHENRPIWVYFIDKKVVEWAPGEDWQMGNAITQRWLERYKERKRYYHP